METWPQLIAQVGTPSAIFLILFWWIANKLIPQLQADRTEAIRAFREEMQIERASHQHLMQQVIEHCQEELKILVENKSD